MFLQVTANIRREADCSSIRRTFTSKYINFGKNFVPNQPIPYL